VSDLHGLADQIFVSLMPPLLSTIVHLSNVPSLSNQAIYMHQYN